MAFQWGYSENNGPSTWCDHVPASRGDRQSPIDIIPSKATFDQALADRPLTITYNPKQVQQLINTGFSLQVTYDQDGSLLEGGPLNHRYRVAQFHFHWGSQDGSGSEHTVDGKTYSAEAHIVHYNSDLYASFGEAASHSDGLSVLGMFINVGQENADFTKLTDMMAKIPFKGDKCDIVEGFDPNCLLPKDTTKYWTYPGSLTTPPCYESVTWIVFKEPIEMSSQQLAALRKMNSHTQDDCAHKGLIQDNFRPPTALNERTVRATFRKFFT